MGKYAISKQFGLACRMTPPFNRFVLPIGARLIKNCHKILKKDSGVTFSEYALGNFKIYFIKPMNLSDKSSAENGADKNTADKQDGFKGVHENLPCLMFYHGGSFSIPAYFCHYKIGLRYAKECGMCVAFVDYRLAPKHTYPAAKNDATAALKWVYDNAQRLGVDVKRFAIVGDSAGGNLAANAAMYAKQHDIPLAFQMYIYPVIDPYTETKSQKIFTDTPVWNSVLNTKMWNMYLGVDKQKDVARIPENFPLLLAEDAPVNDAPCYIETAEFDCLRDEGELFAEKLKKEGALVEHHRINNAMHGYEIIDCDITNAAIKKRIDFMIKHI